MRVVVVQPAQNERVATALDLGAPGAGEHAVRLERDAAAPGLLFARLRQGGVNVVGKAVVLK